MSDAKPIKSCVIIKDEKTGEEHEGNLSELFKPEPKCVNCSNMVRATPFDVLNKQYSFYDCCCLKCFREKFEEKARRGEIRDCLRIINESNYSKEFEDVLIMEGFDGSPVHTNSEIACELGNCTINNIQEKLRNKLKDLEASKK